MADSKKPETSREADVVDFATFLATVRPKTAQELGEEVQRLVGKIRDTGKKGSLTLTLTIQPMQGDVDALIVNDEIRVKAPEHDRKGSLAYPDAHNNLGRTDPSAMPLFDDDLRHPTFRADTGEIKEPRTND